MNSEESAASPGSIATGFIWALVAYATYSTHDVFVKLLGDFSVFQIVFFAMLFGYVPFSLALIREPHPVRFRPVNGRLVLLRSILMVGSLCSAFTAFSLLPMVQVYVLIFMTPLIVSVLAIPLLGEKIHLIRWAAILIGLIGILIVLRPTPDSISLGHAFGLLAAFCGAGAVIIARKVGGEENSATMIVYPLLVNIAVTGVALAFVYKPMAFTDLLLMFGIGTLGLLGQYCLLRAFRNAPAAIVAPMQYSQIIWAIIFGAVFFGEQIDHWGLLGASITVMSGIIIIWRETKVSKNQPNLKTRNSRGVVAPPMQTVEIEEQQALERNEAASLRG